MRQAANLSPSNLAVASPLADQAWADEKALKKKTSRAAERARAAVVTQFGVPIVYLATLSVLGITWGKALVVTAIVLLLLSLGLWQRVIAHLGAVLLGFSLAVWLELIPPLARWKVLIFSLFPPG